MGGVRGRGCAWYGRLCVAGGVAGGMHGACMAGGMHGRGHAFLWGRRAWPRTSPPVDGQMPVKILPYPKFCLRAVNIRDTIGLNCSHKAFTHYFIFR